jgi:hypothetical protein
VRDQGVPQARQNSQLAMHRLLGLLVWYAFVLLRQVLSDPPLQAEALANFRPSFVPMVTLL